jgi:anti-sigma B factor antagonist
VENQFRVVGHNEGQVRVISVGGELDLAVAGSLEKELEQALSSMATRIVVDLHDLEFIDSTGLGVLVSAHRRATDSGLEFGIVNPSSQVSRLLQLTGLTERLQLP